MNKKLFLLAVTTISSISVTAIAVMSFSNGFMNALAFNHRNVDPSYGVTMNKDNYSVNNQTITSDANSGTWTFQFEKGTNTYVQCGDFPFYGGGNAFLSFKGSSDFAYIFNKKSSAMYGITSVKVNYCRYDDSTTTLSAGETGDLKIMYKYVDSQGDFLDENAGGHDLSPNIAYDMSDLQPRYFKITSSDASQRINIESIVVNYSCDLTRSDAKVREDIFAKEFCGAPTLISSTYPQTWRYGYYPQSLSYMSDIFEIDFDESTWEPLENGYYFLQGDFYARVQAQSSGYNGEYTEGEYYWFTVEPVIWKQYHSKKSAVTTGTVNRYLITEKIIDTSIFDVYEGQTTYESSTVLGQKMTDLYNNMLPSNRSSHVNTSSIQNEIESQTKTSIYPIAQSNLSNNGTAFADGKLNKQAVATDYARCKAYSNTDISSNKEMSYWTRTSSNEVVTPSGTISQVTGSKYVSYFDSYGVRPAAKIVL